MKKITTFLILFFFMSSAWTQTLFNIKGEKNESIVSLMWTVKSWQDSMDGVNIKRRVDNGVWEKLNKQLIEPYNSLSKDLSNISNDAVRVDNVLKLREEYFANEEDLSTKLTAVKKEELIDNLQDETFAYTFNNLFIYDFDIALMFGFGYVDINVPISLKIEYGLFPVINGVEVDEPSSIYTWNDGDVLDLSVEIIKQRISKRNSVVSLYWQIDKDKIDQNEQISGFNILRKPTDGEFEKINSTLIWINRAGNNRIVSFKDIITDMTTNYLYSLVPISIFKTTGEGYEMALNTSLPDKTPAPVLKSEIEYGFDFKQYGVNIEWEFNEELNSRIEGFVVLRNIMPSIEWEAISDTIDANIRKYHDNTLHNHKGQKFYYKISAIQESSYPLVSNTLSLFYDPVAKPSKTPKLTATVEVENGKSFVNLSWTKDQEFFNQINGFRLRSDFGGSVLAGSSRLPLIKDFNYIYNVDGISGKEYRFAIFYENNKGVQEPYTDTVKVIVPSKSLPLLDIWPISVQDNKVTIEWKYSDDIIDLAGFRIFVDGTQVDSEDNVKSEMRTWTSQEYEIGRYEITIQAITEYGVLSRMSKPKIFVIR